MIAYVIKSSLCIALLWGFYTLFLEREKIHHFKRCYLLFSLVFAYTIPLITITYTSDAIPTPDTLQKPVTYVTHVTDVPVVEPSINYLFILLYSIYGIGVFAFAVRFLRNMYHLIKKVRNNENHKELSHVNVLLNDSIVPYTFLKYIFVSKKAFQNKAIPQEVLLHEQTHVQQKHTLDIIFVEVLQIIFWFNPLWFWIKKSIRLNHEFLADQKVLKQQYSIHQYMNLLVTYPNSTHHTVLTSPINYSLTKKRIVMMSQQFSKTRAATRLLLLLPILLGCMLLFNNEIIAQQKKIKYTKTVSETHPDKKIKIRVKKDQITVNGTATKLSGFASTIDAMTKQWKDDELTDFQFDVEIMNSEDAFVQKLNEAYRETRLYGANPDGHDLIPPPPPLPETPGAIKNTSSDIAVPPPAPKVKKGEKSNIPPPPAPPKVPSSLHSQIEYDEIENDVERSIEETEELMQEAEQARLEAEVEREIAMTLAEEVRLEAEEINAIAMQEVEEASEIAMQAAQEARAIAIAEMHKAHERSLKVRAKGMRKAEKLRIEAEARAVIHSKLAQEQARAAMEQANKAREEARFNAEKARRQAEKARNEALNEARKARSEVRKEVEKARKEARKAMMKARKQQRKAIERARKERN